jgi:hypothetical protein
VSCFGQTTTIPKLNALEEAFCNDDIAVASNVLLLDASIESRAASSGNYRVSVNAVFRTPTLAAIQRGDRLDIIANNSTSLLVNQQYYFVLTSAKT